MHLLRTNLNNYMNYLNSILCLQTQLIDICIFRMITHENYGLAENDRNLQIEYKGAFL